jgi:hypothetical protein
LLSKKSPGGSLFPYYYKNGELFGAHYESFETREQDLLALMKDEEEFMGKQNHPLPYWVNFYGTKLSSTIASEFMQSMKRLTRFIPKLAIVGCSFFEKNAWKKRERTSTRLLKFVILAILKLPNHGYYLSISLVNPGKY